MTNTLLSKYTRSLLSLIYPDLCMTCGSTLYGNEEIVCTDCRYSLPETHYHKSPDNPVEQLFWGRLPVKHATALLYFDKGSKYNRLIYQLKYRGRTDAGLFLGRLFGSVLKEGSFSACDCIIPIPLHRAQLRRRGFNQSQVIAEGMAEILNRPVYSDVLRRKIYTHSQTRRKRYDRWKNVEGSFTLQQQERITDKHILLVDDVVTTGATMEAAGSVLLSVKGVQLSVAAVTYSHI